MSFLKSAPVLVVLSALFAGCGKPAPESLCDAEEACGLLTDGQTAQQCGINTDFVLDLLHKDATCAELADRLEGAMSCASGLSCHDLKSLDVGVIESPAEVPAGSACHDERVAFLEEASSGKCQLFADQSAAAAPPSQEQGLKRCAGLDCPQGTLQFACDDRPAHGTCYDFTTLSGRKAPAEPICHGAVIQERCASPNTIGFCVMGGDDDVQTKLRYYQGFSVPWTELDAHEDCQKRGGVFTPF